MNKVWMIYGHKGRKSVILARPPQNPRGFYLGERMGERNLRFLLGYVSITSFLTAEDSWEWDEPIEVEISRLSEEYFKGVSVTGISAHFDDYPNALEIGKIAKAAGSLTVLGGPYPSNCAELISRKRGEIFDWVVKGPGEIPFLEITRGNFPDSRVVDGTKTRLPLDLLPRMIRKVWSVGGTEERKSSLIRWSEGCPQALGKKPCSFCSILHAGCASHRTTDQIIDEMRDLHDLGCSWVEIVDDDMVGIMGKKNIRLLVEEIEAGRCPKMEIYIHAGIHSIKDLETLDLLKRLGVVVIQTGFETADPYLKGMNANKATVEEENIFIDRCAQLGISLHPSMVIGLSGETKETMAATFSRAIDIAARVPIYGIQADPIIVLPGCSDYEKLVEVFPSLAEIDIIDVEGTTRAWLSRFTEISLEEATALHYQIIPKIPAQATVGWHLRNPS